MKVNLYVWKLRDSKAPDLCSSGLVKAKYTKRGALFIMLCQLGNLATRQLACLCLSVVAIAVA